MKRNKALTLTVLIRATSNYGESLGNIASIQKVFRNGKTYAVRSRESLKNAVMVQSGMYDDLSVEIDGAAQKKVSEEVNASNCRALEGGYMNTKELTKIRKSSFYFTDAVACNEFVNETRFHNNLFLATTFAKQEGMNMQERDTDEQSGAKKSGLMPYQYEFDKSLKVYSMTIDLDRVGVDENFDAEASSKEKAERVNLILDAIENLRLVVKGNLDNAEPIFIVGGIGEYKTHYFENVVTVKDLKLTISQDIKNKLSKGYNSALIRGGNLENEEEIIEQLKPFEIGEFFDALREEVNEYYESAKN